MGKVIQSDKKAFHSMYDVPFSNVKPVSKLDSKMKFPITVILTLLWMSSFLLILTTCMSTPGQIKLKQLSSYTNLKQEKTFGEEKPDIFLDRRVHYNPYRILHNPLPRENQEFQELDDQMYGVVQDYQGAITGRVFDTHSGAPIPNAKVTLSHGYNTSPIELLTNENGLFHADNLNTQYNPYLVHVSAPRYTGLLKKTMLVPNMAELHLGLNYAHYHTLEENDEKRIYDAQYKAELSLPANIVKRIDGQAVVYPIKVAISYIDPKGNLEDMPGMDMLIESPGTGEVKPMSTVGAVIIDAKDAEDVPLRIDDSKSQSENKQTELRISVEDFLNKGALPAGLQTYEFDPVAGDATWQKTNTPTNIPPSLVELVAAEFEPGYLRSYAEDVSRRLNETYTSDYGAISACFDDIDDTSDSVSVNPSVSDVLILSGLLNVLIQDLTMQDAPIPCNLYGGGEGAFNQAPAGSSAEYAHQGPFWEVFDVEYKLQQYPAGTYTCDDEEKMYLGFPETYSKQFDYQPFIEKANRLCSIIEASVWDQAVKVIQVDLIPFNLDYPWAGTPVRFDLKETNGDGRFKAVLTADSSKGKFSVIRIFNAPGQIAQMNILAPSNTEAKLTIYSEFAQEDPVRIRPYQLPYSNQLYKWGENGKKTFVTIEGTPPSWKLMDELIF